METNLKIKRKADCRKSKATGSTLYDVVFDSRSRDTTELQTKVTDDVTESAPH